MSTLRAKSLQVTQVDLADRFDFSDAIADINPRIPPEGTIPFRETYADKSSIFQFTLQSRMLRTIAVHQN
ncbi:hypothetical protein ACLMAJ_04060 [Nocardia sp. KC 131]|uniref:hypothetical protein n=1 Tax=Nocardia arseniciresistens TaxID=3392119 RepID=UPI00398E72FC